MSKLRNYIKLFVGWPLSIISLIFIIRLVSEKSQSILPYLKNISLSFLILSLCTFLLYYFIRGVLWKKVLEYQGRKIGYLENAYRFEIAELRRYIPGNIWSYVSRATVYGEIGMSKTDVTKSLLLEGQLVVLGCLIASVFAISWILFASADLRLKLISLLPICIILAGAFFVVTAIIYKRNYSKNKNVLLLLFLPGFSTIQKIKLTAISTIVFCIFGLAYYFSLM